MLSLKIIFRFILLLLSIIGLNAREGPSEISLQNVITDRKKYDEYIINRSEGIHEITGFKQNDSTVGMILVHVFYTADCRSKFFEWAEPIKNISKAGLPMWLYRYDWNQCPSITAMQINSDLATLLEKNNQLRNYKQKQ